ncbi:MAG TPA: MBL fold metallo-hydrolase [Candidatus Portnoybacteria bacterium]|jgi:competence protein ComEC|nr:MBL fold metallo-hydrolase [Candidatus Portnoybacteria bacterium]MDD5751960.1 MBL fold metallo-hydrolase [Candidatus Portnoybacteria bacterium]HNU96656.1 MBL fold metallo-hydrolase [Candidatus Portnoybacteria bacterium]HOZ16236.1 MBL fold metallo-hydrolase [Candidatus Portnoybacteria bacterium]HPH51968.1 MBL fold metallo-hydrolase [Candidatus Portnoybacteria bacterium]
MLIRKYQGKILLGLLVITIVVWIFVFQESTPNKFLEINFLDVGQGDAIFIESLNKQQMLIDGGPDASILEKLGRVMNFYDHYIDIVLLTHPEQDHINGLIEVLKRYNVGEIVFTGTIRDTAQYQEFINLIKNKNIPIKIAYQGEKIDFGDGINLNILYPFENLKNQKLSDNNNSSIVSKLVYKNFELLLTGDIEKSVENKLIKEKVNLTADVIKIAHHGSKTSTSEAFLKAVNAIMAVIEVGKDNKYGHPHQEVLDRLKNLIVLQTGIEGNIQLLTDGERIIKK